jgi:hypothetical protein
MKAVVLIIILAAGGLIIPRHSFAAPSAETAKRCMRYSYVAYPYKRPGSVRMSGDRQSYFKDCVEKEGNVPPPDSPTPAP